MAVRRSRRRRGGLGVAVGAGGLLFSSLTPLLALVPLPPRRRRVVRPKKVVAPLLLGEVDLRVEVVVVV